VQAGRAGMRAELTPEQLLGVLVYGIFYDLPHSGASVVFPTEASGAADLIWTDVLNSPDDERPPSLMYEVVVLNIDALGIRPDHDGLSGLYRQIIWASFDAVLKLRNKSSVTPLNTRKCDK
jgi:hypothetical protein